MAQLDAQTAALLKQAEEDAKWNHKSMEAAINESAARTKMYEAIAQTVNSVNQTIIPSVHKLIGDVREAVARDAERR